MFYLEDTTLECVNFISQNVYHQQFVLWMILIVIFLSNLKEFIKHNI